MSADKCPLFCAGYDDKHCPYHDLKVGVGPMSDKPTPTPRTPRDMAMGRNAEAASKPAPPAPTADELLRRISDYRSGYSCGHSDGKNGVRLRDKDAACLFFGHETSGIPDIFTEVEPAQPARQERCPKCDMKIPAMMPCDDPWHDRSEGEPARSSESKRR